VKVLHLIQRYPPAVGGSETWCREIARYLRSVGDDVKVLTLDVLEEEDYWRDPPPRQWTTRLGRLDWDDGILVRRYRRSLPIHLLYHFFLKIVLDQILRIYFYGPHSIEMYGRLFSEVKVADVVHLHTIPYPHNWVGYIAARLHRKRVVMTPHFHPTHPHYERWSNYWLLKHCDAVIAVSAYERDYLAEKGVAPQKISVTGNGVRLEDYSPSDLQTYARELRRRHGLSSMTRIILFIGRKLEYKGLVTLIEAVRTLTAADDVALLMAGPSTTWFEDFYRQLGKQAKQRIIDLGTVPHQEKVNLLHLADVLVLPSHFEAFGIVFLEAWACGTPVIGAATGAIPSVVGEGGLTFAYGDAGELAEKLRMILASQDDASVMASQGRQRLLGKFTWEKIGAATRRAYLPSAAQHLRILICSSFFPPHYLGGAELIAYQQAKILQRMGHEVRVFYGRLGKSLLRPHRAKTVDDEFSKTWVSLSPSDISGTSWDFRSPEIAREFRRVLDEFSPDVVHFHNLVGLSVMMIEACHRQGIPTVMTLHDYWGICHKNTLIKNRGDICLEGGLACLGCREMLTGNLPLPSPVRNAHILFALRKIDCFIAPSRYLAERYAANGLPRERIAVLKNGIELENFPPGSRRRRTLTLGFIGHLGKHKGLDVLLHALSLIDCTNIRLLVAGTGEELEALKAFSRQLGLEAFVTFLGHVDNRRITRVYRQIDVLVVPSVWPENSPVTITEAMASGIPVIASDVGGISELVEDGVTGFLLPIRDSRGIAQRIERFLARPELKQEMGERALAKIRPYHMQNQVERIVGVYLQAKRGQQPSPPLAFAVLLYDATADWDRALWEMFQRLAEVEARLGTRLLICRADLADDEVWHQAKFLVVLSSGERAYRQAIRALRWGMPILVPEAEEELRDLCLTSNGGLYHANSEELKACLIRLLSDDPLREAIGKNGQRFVAEQLPPSVVAHNAADL